MARTSITIDSDYLKKISVLGGKFGMNNKMLIQTMIDYFEFYQINPLERDVNLDSKFSAFDKKIDKLRDTFVSFIRELEKKKLEPLIKQSNESTMALLIYLKEKAITTDNISNYIGGGSGGRRVAAFERKENAANTQESNPKDESKPLDEINIYKEKANEVLKTYKTYFFEMVNSVSRKDEKGDFLLMSAVNEFKDKVKDINKKIPYEGQKTEEAFEVMDRVQTIIRTVDNYCDEFLNQGKPAVGKDKFFFIHSIQEYRMKFENAKIQ
ncbi:MAG: BfmA/BtgA family mobilization protein [Tenuifilaceae bacterium]